jgi:hypothetical protein
VNIFTIPTTFQGTTNGNHDLKIFNYTDITIDFIGNVMMNKIMDASIVKKDYDLHVLNVSNELEGLGRRELNEGMQ